MVRTLNIVNYAATTPHVTYTVKGPQGIVFSSPTKGKLMLAKGAAVKLPLAFAVKGRVEGEIELEVQGAGAGNYRKSWPLFVQMSAQNYKIAMATVGYVYC